MANTKILQVIPYFHPAHAFGGPAKVAYQISNELSKRGHELVVYTSDARDPRSRLTEDSESIIDGVRVCYFKNLAMTLVRDYNLFVTPQLLSHAMSEVSGFDVIHLHEYTTLQNIIIAHYARRWGVPYILQAHGSLPRIMEKKKLKLIYDIVFGHRLLRDASKLIALTEAEALQYRVMGLPKENVAMIPNGIDLAEFASLPSHGCFKKKFGIHHNEKIILYLGRIHKIKGIDYLVKAFAQLVKNGNRDCAKLAIVGPDDGYLSELQALIKTLRIEKEVLVSGPLYGRDKLEAYVDASMYVLPSRYETFPMGLLEAYACSKPVIASDVGGLGDLVVDRLSGLLVRPGDEDQLAHSILALLNDSDQARKMGANALAIVRENFTIQKTVDRLEDVYRRAVAR